MTLKKQQHILEETAACELHLCDCKLPRNKDESQKEDMQHDAGGCLRNPGVDLNDRMKSYISKSLLGLKY